MLGLTKKLNHRSHICIATYVWAYPNLHASNAD